LSENHLFCRRSLGGANRLQQRGKPRQSRGFVNKAATAPQLVGNLDSVRGRVGSMSKGRRQGKGDAMWLAKLDMIEMTAQ
jgi:hypothetical protein